VIKYVYGLFDKNINQKVRAAVLIKKTSAIKKFYIFVRFFYMLFNKFSLGYT
jgi:hypothetical protein